MISSELRANARESLNGKWGKAVLMVLSFFIIYIVISFILNLIPVIGQICLTIISLPLGYGFLTSFLKLKRDEEVGYIDFISIGFSSFGKVWAVFGNMVLKLIVPLIIAFGFIILFTYGVTGAIAHIHSTSFFTIYGNPGGYVFPTAIGMIGYIISMIYLAIKSYYYVLSYYILYDNPDMTGKEIVEKSKELMTGKRWSFFWLGLTFIGWVILSAFTLYIGMLWLFPYMLVTFICFYDSLLKKDTVVEVIDSKEDKSKENDSKEDDSNPISE